MNYNISIASDSGDDPELPGNGKCKAFTLSYVDAQGKVFSVVSADAEVEVSNMPLLGCSAASAALRAVEIASKGEDNETAAEDASFNKSASKHSSKAEAAESVISLLTQKM